MLTALYMASLAYCYIQYLTPRYANLGFHEYNPQDYDFYVQAVAIGVTLLITFLFPEKFQYLSEFSSVFIFYLLFVPIMVYVPMQGHAVNASFEFVAAMAISFLAIILIPRLLHGRAIRVTYRFRSLNWFYYAFLGSYALALIYVWSIYGSHMKFVATSDVFSQRTEAARLTVGTYAGYVLGWISGCFTPFLLAVGMTERRRLFVGIGVLGAAFVYGVAAHKLILMGTAAVFLFHYFCISSSSFRPIRLALITTTGIAVPTAIIAALGTDLPWPLGEAVDLVVMRAYGVQAVSTGWYYEFFLQNPRTYYSHINVVRLFIDYPYGELSLGQVMGWEKAHTVDFNVSANYWASDGFAAAGALGVVVIGIVIGVLLAIIDALYPMEKLTVMCTATIIPLVMLTEAPLGSVLLTGGAIFLYLFLMFWQPRSKKVEA